MLFLGFFSVCFFYSPFVFFLLQLLIAITPITIEGNSIAPECLAGNVARENEKKTTTAELDKEAVASIERKMVQSAPNGNGIGEAVREAL